MTNQQMSKMAYAFRQEGNVYKIYLYDTVTKNGEFDWKTFEEKESETSAKYFKEQLESIPEEAKIELYINSNGGEVWEGTAICSQLMRHSAHKTGIVDGCAHSIAGVILQACDKRIMNNGTAMLVHNMWVKMCGNAKELRKKADDLDALSESNRKIFLNRINISEEKLIELMEAETMLTPEQCLEYGFCDEIAKQGTKPEISQMIPESQKETNKKPEMNEGDIQEPVLPVKKTKLLMQAFVKAMQHYN